jgi:long-chain acyl-CoA synthetase
MQARDAAAERASLDAEVQEKTLCDVLVRNAEERGDRPALAWKQDGAWQHLTWKEYRQRVAELAMGLATLGVERGDFVALMLRNRPEHVLADLGAVHLGATAVSLYNTLAPDQIAYIAGHCEAKVAVIEDRAVMERWEKVREELPGLRWVVLLDDAEAFADYDWVLSWDDLLSKGRQALAGHPAAFEAARKAVRPDDPATLIYTSGTTGPPKGVVITHRNALWTAASVQRWSAPNEEGRWPSDPRYLSYLPLAHSFERLSGHYNALWRGLHVHFCPEVLQVVAYLPEVRPFTFVAVPRLWEKAHAGIEAAIAAEPNERRRRLAERAIETGRAAVRLRLAGEPVPLGLRLRLALLDRLVLVKIRRRIGLDQCLLAVSGAAPIAPEILEFFLAIGVNMAEGYGLTENTAAAFVTPPQHPKPGTVGPPMPGVEVRLAGDGEVLIRGGNVTAGYYKEPDRTAETFDADGWLHTGDVGEFDDEGFLRIVDRKKELIVTAGGKNVSPANLENLLKRHPLVGQACAVGDRQRYIAALIVLDPEVAPAWAKRAGLDATRVDELARDERVLAEIQRAVDDANQYVSSAEAIKRFTLLPAEWTVDTDELTPTLKLKRRVIHERYAAEISALYE